ncbi:MAG: glycine/betaine ABC transporter [Methanoculleus sp. SDB]|nr:MAG: glycine/betaine ABC transporter [Methanoculleus sp. SDB]
MIPKLPVGEGVEMLVDFIDDYFGWLLDAISGVLDLLVNGFQQMLLVIHPAFIILFFAIAAYLVNRRDIRSAALTGLGLFLIWDLQLWPEAMTTLALVIASTVIALIVGVPSGILASGNNTFDALLKPFLDFMQTMPSFVYLIPAVIFFGLGNVPGMIATVIFAMPPAIRLTNLGIRQIPLELNEVADSFGTTAWQKLIKVQLPVALPTIMAGINQCIMLALSMTVIASMIGAGGLGLNVLKGIQRVDIGGGFEAGLAIVIVAIVLDRLTQNLVRR